MVWVKTELFEDENERLERFKQSNDLNKPNAVRALVLRGLNEWEEEQRRKQNSGINLPQGSNNE